MNATQPPLGELQRRLKIAATQRGKKLTAEHRANQAAAQQKRFADPKERKKQAAASKARWSRIPPPLRKGCFEGRQWSSCVYCEVTLTGRIRRVPDGPGKWACEDSEACERRITNAGTYNHNQRRQRKSERELTWSWVRLGRPMTTCLHCQHRDRRYRMSYVKSMRKFECRDAVACLKRIEILEIAA